MTVRLHRHGNGNYYAYVAAKATGKTIMIEIERMGDGSPYMPVWLMTTNEPGDTGQTYETLAEVRSDIERLYDI